MDVPTELSRRPRCDDDAENVVDERRYDAEGRHEKERKCKMSLLLEGFFGLGTVVEKIIHYKLQYDPQSCSFRIPPVSPSLPNGRPNLDQDEAIQRFRSAAFGETFPFSSRRK
jgi:hypothetical protein